MLYNPPTGSTDPGAPFVGKNVAAGQQGSKIPPKAVEAPQRELVNIIVEGAQSPTNTDMAQALKAIRSGLLWSYAATGTPNALTINPITAHTTTFKGLPFRIFPLYTNTGAVTLTVNALTAPLLRRDGSALVAGDIVPGAPFDIVHDGVSAFRLVAAAFGEVQRLVANPIFWVRPDGNDGNDGSLNTAGNAFATIAGAIAASAKIAAIGGLITIRLGTPGTYASPGAVRRTGGTILIQGDQANQAAYVIAGAGTAGQLVLSASGCAVQLLGLTMSNTGTVAHTVGAANGGTLGIDYVSFTTVAGNPNYHIFGGTVTVGAGIIISGSMGGWLQAGAAILTANVITFVGTPNWTTAGVLATGCGLVSLVGTPTFSGACTGARYAATDNGVVRSNGGGANFYPGSTAGFLLNGGQYV